MGQLGDMLASCHVRLKFNHQPNDLQGCGSETTCEVMKPGFMDWKSNWIQAPPMWRRRYRFDSVYEQTH